MKKLLISTITAGLALSSFTTNALTCPGCCPNPPCMEKTSPTPKTKLEKAKELGNNTSMGNITPITSYRITHNHNHMYKSSTIYIYEDPLNPGKICRLSTGISASHFCEK